MKDIFWISKKLTRCRTFRYAAALIIAWLQCGILFSAAPKLTDEEQQKLDDLILAAESGDAASQAELGLHYLYGGSVEKDEKLAYEWLLKAAEQGDPTGQVGVGRCLRFGQGVKKDIPAAINWYLLSAKQGEGRAFSELGVIYDEGEGVDHDYAKAMSYFQKGRELGDTTSTYNLGNMYWNGRGVRRSVLLALDCFQECAESLPQGQFMVGVCYQQPEVVLRIGEIRAKELAIENFRLAAKKGHELAKVKLAAMNVSQ
jgi:TPR repeat protein